MIGREASSLWAYFIDGGSGILCDTAPCRYFTGAAVGMRNLRSEEPLMTSCMRLCSLWTVCFHI